eukprot:TRINITY_DN2681_c0_g1_i1.p1 TRINITY_DN2681_c0_g1~~TRINITY_DN2681_c0_g1_i1.p1  ORF type:complete len:488 (-),score=133.82 TRINITY_DN2681_c0_g1_i1:62-1525(-)
MGIKRLYGFLHQRQLVRQIPRNVLHKRSIAVDSPMLIYAAYNEMIEKKKIELRANPLAEASIFNTNDLFHDFVYNFIEILVGMKKLDIDMTFVFDGKAEETKTETTEARRQEKSKNQEDLEKKTVTFKEKKKKLLEEEQAIKEDMDNIQKDEENSQEILREVVQLVEDEKKDRSNIDELAKRLETTLDEEERKRLQNKINELQMIKEVKKRKKEELRKKNEILQEKKKKKESQVKEKHIKQQKEIKQMEGESNQLANLSRKSFSLKRVHMKSAIKIIKLLGSKRLTLPGDGEKTCAALARKGMVDYVLSNDSDALVFGSPTVISFDHFAHYQRFGLGLHKIDLAEVLSTLEMTSDQFIDFCIICGTDYLRDLSYPPPVAYNIFQKYKNDIYSAPQTQKYVEKMREVKNLFLKYDHDDRLVVKETPVVQEDLFRFLHDVGFPPEKEKAVREMLLSVMSDSVPHFPAIDPVPVSFPVPVVPKNSLLNPN